MPIFDMALRRLSALMLPRQGARTASLLHKVDKDLASDLQTIIQQAKADKRSTFVAVRDALEKIKASTQSAAPAVIESPEQSQARAQERKQLEHPVAIVGPRKPYKLRPGRSRGTRTSFVVFCV